MDWETFVQAAAATSWVTYLGTRDRAGAPHVSVVAPGYTPGSVWFATRTGSRKFKNLIADPRAAFHWPVGNDAAPGEVIASGRAATYTSQDDRSRLWHSGILPYDLSQFFGQETNEGVAFVEVEIDHARLLGGDFVPRRWTR